MKPQITVITNEGKTKSSPSGDKTNLIYECPECRLKYKDAEWAGKCELWCREHHSCNLEIIKHAEK